MIRMLRPSASLSLFLTALAFALAASSCVGRNVHKDLKADPEILMQTWAYQTHGAYDAGDRGIEFSNPVLNDNTLIFGSRAVGLISLYPDLLSRRWTFPVRGGIVSALTIEKGAVFFGGADGFLYSVNADTGRVNWRYDLHNPVISRPTVDSGRVFVTTSDDTVYAFDQGTGKWLWHYRRRSSPVATVLGASQPLVDNGEVIAGLSDGFLVAVSMNDGQLKWERKLHQGTRFTDVDAHPILDKSGDRSTLYVPSYDGALYALKRQGGEIIWRFDAGGSKNIVLDDQLIYLPSSDGSIYCLQKSTSRVLWKFDLDAGVPSQLVVTDRYVIAGSSFQYLYVLDKMTGKGLYRYNVGWGSGFRGSPAYDREKHHVYLVSDVGNLYQFKLKQRGDSRSKPTNASGLLEGNP